MPTFIITRTIKHTETAVVEAIDKWEALAQACDEEFLPQNDEFIHDEQIEEVK